MDTEDVEPRSLMLPYPFHTSVDDTASLELHQALLGRLGARVEEVGPNRFLVRSLPALLGDMNCEQWVRLTLPCLRSGHENEDIRAALLRAWVGLVERRDGPLAVNDIRRLLELDANKAKGVQGYYRYGVTKKVTYDEVVQKTSPKRL
jgi:DNA mismatch repair ATPase MutL